MQTHTSHTFVPYIKLALIVFILFAGFGWGSSFAEAAVVLSADGNTWTSVDDGGEVTLAWDVTGESNCGITGPSGYNNVVTGTGSTNVYPTGDKKATYTLSCDSGSDTADVYFLPDVTVTAPATVVRDAYGSALFDYTFSAVDATNCGPTGYTTPSGSSRYHQTSSLFPVTGRTYTLDNELDEENGVYIVGVSCTNNTDGRALTNYSTVSVSVTGSDPVTYTPPSCPWSGANVYTFDASKKLRQDSASNREFSVLEPVTLGAGTYTVKTYGWDGYPTRTTVLDQDEEQGFIRFLSSGTEIARTGYTSDILDGPTVAQDAREDTFTNINLASAVDGITIRHINADTGGSPPNSFTPICTEVTLTGAPLPSGTVSLQASSDGSTTFAGGALSINSGDTVTLGWNATNIQAGSCELSSFALSAYTVADDTSNPTNYETDTPVVDDTYVITCLGLDGIPVSDSVDVTVVAAPVSGVVDLQVSSDGGVSFSTGDTTITTADTVDFKWTTTNIVSGSCQFQKEAGLVDPAADTVTAAPYERENPVATHTYTLTCDENPGPGTVTDSITVTVGDVPTVSISANPTSISPGETTNITWSSSGATSCSLTSTDNVLTSSAFSGTNVESAVLPNANSTYTFTLTCSNAYGSPSAPATVTTGSFPPSREQNLTDPTISWNPITSWTKAVPAGVYTNVAIDGEIQNLYNTIGGTATITDSFDNTMTITLDSDWLSAYPGRFTSPIIETVSHASSLNPGEVGTLSFVISELPFGVHTLSFSADIGDVITEGAEGDNSITTPFTIDIPEPTLSLTASEGLVQSGEVVNLRWEVGARYPLDCVVRGPMNFVPYEFTTTNRLDTALYPLPADDVYVDVGTSSPLYNSSVFELSCTENAVTGGTTFSTTAETRIEVIPSIYE